MKKIFNSGLASILGTMTGAFIGYYLAATLVEINPKTFTAKEVVEIIDAYGARAEQDEKTILAYANLMGDVYQYSMLGDSIRKYAPCPNPDCQRWGIDSTLTILDPLYKKKFKLDNSIDSQLARLEMIINY